MSIITRINKAEKRIVDLYNKLKNLPSGGVQSVTGGTLIDNTDPSNPAIVDAPSDGVQYARKDGNWSEIGLSAKQDKIQQITPVTLLTSGWTLVSDLYEYNYSNVNITANTIVDAIPDNSTIEIVKTAEILPQTNSLNGSVKFFSKNLPTSNIIVTLNIFN